MKRIGIGSGNYVNAGRLIAVVSPDSAPIKRLVQENRERGRLIDATFGRRTGSVMITDSDHVILSYLSPERILGRVGAESQNDSEAVLNEQ